MGLMGRQALRFAQLAEVDLLAGRADDVANLAGRALEQSRQRRERGSEAWILRLLGDVAARSSPTLIQAWRNSVSDGAWPATRMYREMEMSFWLRRALSRRG
jgi:hypothetical protein